MFYKGLICLCVVQLCTSILHGSEDKSENLVTATLAISDENNIFKAFYTPKRHSEKYAASIQIKHKNNWESIAREEGTAEPSLPHSVEVVHLSHYDANGIENSTITRNAQIVSDDIVILDEGEENYEVEDDYEMGEDAHINTSTYLSTKMDEKKTSDAIVDSTESGVEKYYRSDESGGEQSSGIDGNKNNKIPTGTYEIDVMYITNSENSFVQKPTTIQFGKNDNQYDAGHIDYENDYYDEDDEDEGEDEDEDEDMNQYDDHQNSTNNNEYTPTDINTTKDMTVGVYVKIKTEEKSHNSIKSTKNEYIASPEIKNGHLDYFKAVEKTMHKGTNEDNNTATLIKTIRIFSGTNAYKYTPTSTPKPTPTSTSTSSITLTPTPTPTSMSILPKKLNINSDTFDRDNIHAYFTNAMRIDEHLTYANEGNISIGETKITFSLSTTLVFSEKPTIRHKANLQKTESKHKMESVENVVQNTQNNSINEPPEHIIRVADNISIEPTIPPQWVGKAAKSDIDDKLRAIGEYENLITTETANGVSKDQGNIRLIVNTEKASKYIESIFDKVFIPSPTGTQKVAKSISRVSPTEVLDKHTLQTIGYRESKEKKDKDKTPNRVCRKKIFNGIKNIRILMEPQPYQKHLTKSTSNKYIGRKNINGYGKNHLYNLHFKNLEENHLHGRPKTVPKRCQRIKHKVWRNQNNKLLGGSSERSKKDVEFKSDAKFRLRTHKYVGYYGRKNNSKESQFRNNMKEKTCRARNNIKVKKRTRSRYNAKYNKGLYKTSEKRSTNAEGRTKQNLSRYTSKFRFGVPIGYNYNIYHRKLRAQDAIRYFGYGNTIVPDNTYEQGRCRPGIAYNIHECHLDDDDITEM